MNFIYLVVLLTFPVEVDLDKMCKVLMHVESNWNPKAIGDSGKAYGILQIHKACVDDVNRTYKTKFKHKDCFDPKISKTIFKLYIKKGQRLFKRKYGKEASEKDLVRMWNGGIYKGYRYKSTLKYWFRYVKFKKRCKK